MREIILHYGKYIAYGLAVINLLLTVSLLSTNRSISKSLAMIMGLVGLGLTYDAVIVAIGSLLKDNSLLLPLSQARYYLHGVMVPLMIPISLYALQPTKQGKVFTWILTLVFLALGIAIAYFTKLEPKEIASIYRYTTAAETPKWASIADGIMTIGGVVLLLVSSVIVLKNQKNIALLLSGIFMLVFSALGPVTGNLDLSFLIGMVGETLMLLFFLIYVRTVKGEE